MQFVLRARLNEKQAKSMQQVYGFQILYVLQFISFDNLLKNIILNTTLYIKYKVSVYVILVLFFHILEHLPALNSYKLQLRQNTKPKRFR